MSFTNTLLPNRNRSFARNDRAGASNDLGPTIKPLYQIKETDDAYAVTVFLPGVSKDILDMTVEAGEIRIVGRRAWKQPEGWTALYRESPDATYELTLAHDNAVETDKVTAQLGEGVLRVSLPKAEALKPRKITVS